MDRITVLDPGLSSVLSHHSTLANALVREAKELGLEIDIKCHLGAEPEIRNTPAEPYFRQAGYGYVDGSRPSMDFVSIQFANRSIYEDLKRLSGTIGKDDFVLFSTVTCNQVLAICRWISELPDDSAPHMGMYSLFPSFLNTGGVPSTVARKSYEEAFSLLTPEMRQRIAFACELDSLAEDYASLIGTKPRVIDVPSWRTTTPQLESPDRVSHIAFLGGARSEKGFHLLPEIVSTVRQHHPDIRFTIQTTGHEDELLRTVVPQLKSHADAVSLIETPPSESALFEHIRATDLLLLPYDPHSYTTRGSTLFTEARAIGTPTVVSEGIGVSDQAKALGVAELFSPYTPTEAAAATLRAIDRYPTLATTALKESTRFRSTYDGFLIHFLRDLGLRT